MANFFKLTGSNVEVTYRIGGNPGFVSLTFKSGSKTETFKPAEIQTAATPLGSLVTIATRVTIDTGGTTFSFFIPDINVPMGQTVSFTSLGIFKDVSGFIVLPKDVVVTWTAVNLDGTAQTVFVAL